MKEQWIVEQLNPDTNQWELFDGACESYDSYDIAEADMGGPAFFGVGMVRIRRRRISPHEGLLPCGTKVLARAIIIDVDEYDEKLPYRLKTVMAEEDNVASTFWARACDIIAEETK